MVSLLKLTTQSIFCPKGCTGRQLAYFRTTVGLHSSIVKHQISLSAKLPQALTPYSLFVRDNIDKVRNENPTLKKADTLKQLAQQWDSCSGDQELYNNKAQDLSKKLFALMRRPASSYILFVQENYATVTGNTKERVLKLAVQWNQLSSVQKKKYISEASSLGREFAARKAQLSLDDAAALKDLNYAKRLNKVKRIGRIQMRKQLRELAAKYSRPKMPAPGIIPTKESSMAAQWKALTANEREELLNKYRSVLEQYKLDLAAWEQKMIAAGHSDVVEIFRELRRYWKMFLQLSGVRVPSPPNERLLRQQEVEKKRAHRVKAELRKLKKAELMNMERAKLLKEQKDEILNTISELLHLKKADVLNAEDAKQLKKTRTELRRIRQSERFNEKKAKMVMKKKVKLLKQQSPVIVITEKGSAGVTKEDNTGTLTDGKAVEKVRLFLEQNSEGEKYRCAQVIQKEKADDVCSDSEA